MSIVIFLGCNRHATSRGVIDCASQSETRVTFLFRVPTNGRSTEQDRPMTGSFNQPSAAEVPRFARSGDSTVRLPTADTAPGLDIAAVGILGRRYDEPGRCATRAEEVRSQSSLMRRVHHVSGAPEPTASPISPMSAISPSIRSI